MRKLLIFLSFFAICICGSQIVRAQESVGIDEDVVLDEKAIDKINSVVQKIFNETVAAKIKFKELADFDEKCLVKNQDGYLTITYETQVPAAGGTTTLYAFKLDVEPLKAKTYQTHAGYFNYPMPLLDLQFSGYVIKHPLRRQFNLSTALDKYSPELADYQQQFMPLRFMIVTEKETFKVREPIRFKVILANVSKENILVSGLGKDSLFFTINDAIWGASQGQSETNLSAKDLMRQQRQQAREQRAKEREDRRRQKDGIGQTIRGIKTQVGDKLILRADEALTIDFVGEGYKRAQDVEIRGIYQLNIKGVKPTAKLTLKIVE